MSQKLSILTYPDPMLRVVSQEVEEFGESLFKLRKDMLHTMYQSLGIGLAAIQVGISKRIAVIDVSSTKNSPITLINPEITSHKDEYCISEGCLSLPGTVKAIKRYKSITVRFQDKKGLYKTLEAGGLLAACIQHEIDHLNGVLLLDK